MLSVIIVKKILYLIEHNRKLSTFTQEELEKFLSFNEEMRTITIEEIDLTLKKIEDFLILKYGFEMLFKKLYMLKSDFESIRSSNSVTRNNVSLLNEGIDFLIEKIIMFYRVVVELKIVKWVPKVTSNFNEQDFLNDIGNDDIPLKKILGIDTTKELEQIGFSAEKTFKKSNQSLWKSYNFRCRLKNQVLSILNRAYTKDELEEKTNVLMDALLNSSESIHRFFLEGFMLEVDDILQYRKVKFNSNLDGQIKMSGF